MLGQPAKLGDHMRDYIFSLWSTEIVRDEIAKNNGCSCYDSRRSIENDLIGTAKAAGWTLNEIKENERDAMQDVLSIWRAQ